MSAAKGCKCLACAERETHGLPALRLLSNVDNANTSALAARFAAKIFKSYYVVKCASFQFIDIMATRWAGMGLDSRKEFLKSVCPDIPDEHRPDFLYLREPTKKGNIQRRAFDTPQINIADLCEDDAQIGFVASRGQDPPGGFAMLDAENGNLNPSGPHFNAAMWNFFMVMSAQNEEEDYGQTWHLDELKAEGKDHLGDIPPVGLYTLGPAALLPRATCEQWKVDCEADSVDSYG